MRKLIIASILTTAIIGLGAAISFGRDTRTASGAKPVPTPTATPVPQPHEARIAFTVNETRTLAWSPNQYSDLAIDTSNYPANSTFVLGWTVRLADAHLGTSQDPFTSICGELQEPAAQPQVVGSVCAPPQDGPGSPIHNKHYESVPLAITPGAHYYTLVQWQPNSLSLPKPVTSSASLIIRWTE